MPDCARSGWSGEVSTYHDAIAELLPERAEADVAGHLADVYADIRTTLRIPFVGLIYRTLATRPGRLEATWSAIRPLFVDPAAEATLESLRWRPGTFDPIPPLDSGVLEEARLGPAFEARAGTTVRAYRRANGLNLLALSALLGPGPVRGGEGSAPPPPEEVGTGEADGRPPAWAELLPMSALDALPAPDREDLIRFSRLLLPGRGPALVPSLLRHFAVSGLTGPLLRALEPPVASGGVAAAAGQLQALAERAPLPARRWVPAPHDPEVSAIARRFLVATSTMLVVGDLVELALGLDRSGLT